MSEARGDGNPILAAVGPLQFEVATFRMEHEFSAPIRTEQLGLSLAREAAPEHIDTIAAYPGVEMVRRGDGTPLVLLRDIWHARAFERAHPDVPLIPLAASGV